MTWRCGIKATQVSNYSTRRDTTLQCDPAETEEGLRVVLPEKTKRCEERWLAMRATKKAFRRSRRRLTLPRLPSSAVGLQRVVHFSAPVGGSGGGVFPLGLGSGVS